MPEAKPFELRIFCLCGQKMKVTSDMLGKPGKCIACRQKIRIPNEDEVGPDEAVIHLKDHPEFIRRPGGGAGGLPVFHDEPVGDLERDDVLLEGDSGQLAAIAFERFEPIRRLCNYEHKVKRQLQRLREGGPASFDKATLMSYRGLARQARQQLEGVIRDELISIGAELYRIREKLGDIQLAFRSGDSDHVSYSKAVLPFRKRREVLLYRQQNLRGWLATEDPHVAGGYDDVDLADVPMELANGSFPLIDALDDLPIENAVVQLERALRDREAADKLLNALHRMSLDGVLAVDELARRRSDTEAERQRARTAVSFYRGRLEQVIQDCEEDSTALKAYEDVMRGQLASAAIAQDAFKRLEENVFRAQVDVKRARNMANRALNANAVSDVPNPYGTFLERLARPGGLRGLGLDSWLALAGSALLLIKLFVPIAPSGSGAFSLSADGRTLALFLLAAGTALSAAIVIRLLRGALLNTIWLVFTVGSAAYLSGAFSGFAVEEAWWSSFGGILLLGAWTLLGLAAAVSFHALGLVRWVALGNLALGGLVALLLFTEFFGMFRPAPELITPEYGLDASNGMYAVSIPVVNDGQSPFVIGGDGEDGEVSAAYLLEYKIGANSWADAGPPERVLLGGKEVSFRPEDGLRVGDRGRVVFHYQLSPGIYRVQLVPSWQRAMPQRHTFQLDVPDPSLLQPAESALVEPTPRSTTVRKAGVEVELRGVVDGESSAPIFSIVVRGKDGKERKAQYHLDDKIHGEWRIGEFNPAHNTITVVNGERLLVIERGEVVTLD